MRKHPTNAFACQTRGLEPALDAFAFSGGIAA